MSTDRSPLMDSEEQQHLDALRQNYLKRLRVLELKAAQQGADTLAHVLIEIDDIKASIANIDLRRSEFEQDSPAAATPMPMESNPELHIDKHQVEIIFKGSFNGLTPELLGATIRAIAALVDIPTDQVVVQKVFIGSISFLIDMPIEAAKQLMAMYENKDLLLEEINVDQIRSVDSGAIANTLVNNEIHVLQAKVNDLEKMIEDLQQTLEARRLVDRAKGLLMDTQGLKEAEAFRKIQQLSMQTKKSMLEVAKSIILAAETQ
jgi:hypothetical protein